MARLTCPRLPSGPFLLCLASDHFTSPYTHDPFLRFTNSTAWYVGNGQDKHHGLAWPGSILSIVDDALCSFLPRACQRSNSLSAKILRHGSGHVQ